MEHEESASRSATAVFEANILLRGITIWLPARHLLRLSLVDQRWRRITSDPNFRNRHTRHHFIHRTSETTFIIYARPLVLYFNPTTRGMAPRRVNISLTRILQSSHGLMLLECRDSMHDPDYYQVANFTTTERTRLSIETNQTIVPLFLEFDPSKSEYYKVGFLRIASGNHSLDVYDSKTHEWKQPLVPDNFHIPNEIYADDRTRIWLKNRVYSVEAGGTSRTHYMDLEKWSFGTIRTPSTYYNRNYVMAWNGNLYCISLYWRSRSRFMLVHKLREEEESFVWSQTHSVNLNRVQSAWPEMTKGNINVMGMVGGDRDEARSILIHGGEKIVAYRIGDDSFELLFDSIKDMEGRRSLFEYGTYQFQDTFALV